MSFAPCATLEFKELNYNTLWIKNVPSIISTFDVDILFEFPFIDNPHGHFGYMQGMDKKYNGHSWWKVKTTNIMNDFNLVFHKIRCLGHLQFRNKLCNYFILNGSPNEIAWIGNNVQGLNKDYFAFSSPYYKIYIVVSFCVNSCVAHTYYIMHK